MRIDSIGLQLIRGLPLTPVPVDSKVLAAYAGQYQFPNDMVMTIRVDGTCLFMQVSDQGEYELLARSEDQFSLQAYDAEITFYKNANGEVDRLVMVRFGETYEAKKVPYQEVCNGLFIF